MNHYPRHVGDWLRDTAHLSAIEECMYSRMIDQYYTREEPLPSDVATVARLIRAQGAAERKAVDSVLREFFALESDGWHQKRCDREIESYREKSAKAKASAYLSVAVRQAKAQANAERTLEHSLNGRSTNQNQNHKRVTPVVTEASQDRNPKPGDKSPTKGKPEAASSRWWLTDQGTIAEGKRRGVSPRPGEDMQSFRDRVRTARTPT